MIRALDSHSAGDCRSWVQFPAAALSSNNLGQVVHTNVPLFTKQYNLVPCEGFHAKMCQLCGSGMGYNEQGEYCSSVFCSDVDRLNRDINYLLYFLYYYKYKTCLSGGLTLDTGR